MRAAAIGDDALDFELSRRLVRLPEAALLQLVRALSWPQARELLARWSLWAHPGQFRPTGDWRVWLIRAGRGFGKTRAGAEWVCEVARTIPGARIALVGASVEDVAKVIIAGPSGLLNVARPEQAARFRANGGVVELGNDATAHVYSAEAPEKLRGPEHHAAWCDELAKWRYGDAAWDNLMLGMRLGDQPRCVVTTTPKPNALMRKVMALRGLVETRGGTRDNPHLPPAFVAAMTETYGGTRLGRQELDGELIEDAEGALWPRWLIERCRVDAAPMLVRVVVGVDPPAGLDGDACGIVVCGLAAEGVGYVIADGSVQGASPEGWARAVADCAALHGADRVVAEKNNGGEMVRTRYDVGPGVVSEADVRTLLDFYRARLGPARGFRFGDPYDCVSRSGAAPSPVDERIGTGDGTVTRFALVKHYEDAERRITRPVAGSVTVAVDGEATAAFAVQAGGWVALDMAPADGAVVTAGFRFDVPVRFAEDTLSVSRATFLAGEAASVPLVEVREDRP